MNILRLAAEPPISPATQRKHRYRTSVQYYWQPRRSPIPESPDYFNFIASPPSSALRWTYTSVYSRTFVEDAICCQSLPSTAAPIRTEYSVCSNCARSSFSRAIDGRLPSAYIAPNNGDIRFNISSVSSRIARRGWSFVTRSSGDK